MITALYTIEYGDTSEQPKVFIQQRPAVAMYNREAKRLRMGDVTWESVTCKKWVFKGTPRSVASQALYVGSLISNSETNVRQILSEIENDSSIEEEVIAEEINGVMV